MEEPGPSALLLVLPLSGGTPVQLGSSVESFKLSPDGSRVLWSDYAAATEFWGAGTETISLVPTFGGASIPLNAWSTVSFGSDAVVFVRSGTPDPYSFQDGLYVTPML